MVDAWPEPPEAIRAGIVAMVCRQRETVAFKSSEGIDANPSANYSSDHLNARFSLHLPYGTEFPPDLADVVAAWPHLQEAIRAGIVAMVKAVPILVNG